MGEYLQILNDYIKVEDEEQGFIRTTLIDERELSIILESFWTTEYDKLLDKIKNFNGLKTICYGNFPAHPENFIKRSSLYSDLIILEDPIPPYMLNHLLLEKNRSDEKFSVAISGPLQRLNKISDWINEGIVIILPPAIYQCDQYRGVMETLVDNDFKDNSFYNLERQFLNNTIKDYRLYHRQFNDEKLISDDNEFLENYITGELAALNNDFLTSGMLNANITADQKHAWDNITYKLKKDQKTIGKDMLSLVALNKVNIKFLDNVTLDFALKIREEGYLSELRSFFREKFGEIQKTPDENEFNDLINNYSTEIIDQINMHEREWNGITKEAFEKLGVKSGLALSSGSIGGMVSYGLAIPAWVGFLGGILISSNYTIKDILDDILEFRKKRRDLKRNSIHLLYELNTV